MNIPPSDLWSRLPFTPETPLVLAHDDQSPVMHASEIAVKLTGVEIRVHWAHEGSIKSEWVPAVLLKVHK